MSRRNYLFTSESVSEGHPDKVCDRISDTVVDAFLARRSPEARVACETLATTNRIVIAGEVRGPAEADRRDDDRASSRAARSSDIGYEQERLPLGERRRSTCYLHAQSADIAQGVDAAGNKDEGAGDQGIMFGYACQRDAGADAGADPTMPTTSCRLMAEARHSGARPALGPDAKSQVTLRYENGKPVDATSDRRLHPALRCDSSTSDDVRQIVEPYVRQALPRRLGQREHRVARQPDRQFRDRRPGRRLRA